MKNVVLIDPKGILKGLNSGLGYIAANIKANTTIIDMNNTQAKLIKYTDKIKNADFVGISIKTSTYSESLKIIKKIRQINPNTTIVVGGPHPTIDGYDMIKNNAEIDICILGEGEEIVNELITKPISKIKGTIYKKNNKIYVNPGFNVVNDLDKLNIPDFKQFKTKIEFYPLVTSRGCPYQCTYCSVGQVSTRRWRKRSPESVIAELKNAKIKYRCNKFEIIDDNFTLDMNRAKKICKLLISENINMEWICPNGIRADRLDDELVGLMKESGCSLINIGVESGVEKIFDSIKKGEKLSDVIRAIKLIAKHNITVNGFFIIGLSNSNYDNDMKSLKFSKNLPLNSAIWNLFVPYPKTEMFDALKKDKKARWLRDWKEGFHFGDNIKVVFDKKSYPAKKKIKMYYLANLRSNNYGMLATQGSFIKRFLTLSKIIIKYDITRAPLHIIKAIILFVKYRIVNNIRKN